MTLTEFLLARIAEDEARAQKQSAAPEVDPQVYSYIHWARWQPARVLAECEAKRRVVEALGNYDDGYIWAAGESYRAWDALRALALVYSDHLDYDPAWA